MTPLLALSVFMTLFSLVTNAPVNTPNPGPKANIYEILELANSDMDDQLKEGDIMPDPIATSKPDVMGNADPCTLSNTCLWPKDSEGYVQVPVFIDRRFRRHVKAYIEDVLNGIQQVTCVRFPAARKNELAYINIIDGTGCWSYVGRIGRVQDLSLQANGCVWVPIIQHEILHALGFHHEHTRSDRDTMVTINFENIIAGTESNFKKISTNNLETPYDFNSVMQYNNYAWTSNGLMTIVANDDPNRLFGNAQSMSDNDILRINKLYDCTDYLPH